MAKRKTPSKSATTAEPTFPPRQKVARPAGRRISRPTLDSGTSALRRGRHSESFVVTPRVLRGPVPNRVIATAEDARDVASDFCIALQRLQEWAYHDGKFLPIAFQTFCLYGDLLDRQRYPLLHFAFVVREGLQRHKDLRQFLSRFESGELPAQDHHQRWHALCLEEVPGRDLQTALASHEDFRPAPKRRRTTSAVVMEPGPSSARVETVRKIIEEVGEEGKQLPRKTILSKLRGSGNSMGNGELQEVLDVLRTEGAYTVRPNRRRKQRP